MSNKERDVPLREGDDGFPREEDKLLEDVAVESNPLGKRDVASAPDLTRKSARKKTLTPKGMVYSLKNSISAMKACDKRMKKQVGIVTLLLGGQNIDPVNNEMSSIEKTYQEFTELYARACVLLTYEEIGEEIGELAELNTEVSVLMSGMDHQYLECKEVVCSWLLEKEKQNFRTRSVHSGSSKSSSKSSGSKFEIWIVKAFKVESVRRFQLFGFVSKTEGKSGRFESGSRSDAESKGGGVDS